MAKLYVSVGNTPVEQTGAFYSQARLHFDCIAASQDIRSRISSGGQGPCCLPEPVCVVESGLDRAAAVYLPTAPDGVLDTDESDSGRTSAVCPEETEHNVPDNSAGDSTSIDNHPGTNSHANLVGAADNVPGVDCKSGSREDSEEDGEDSDRELSGVDSLTSLSAVQAFQKFLVGTVGERSWNLWLDIERAKMFRDKRLLTRYFMLSL